MRKNSGWLIIVIAAFGMLLNNCGECNDCGVINNEPTVEVRFFSREDSSELKVRIVTINGVPGSSIALFGDTLLKTYNFPLDMNDEISIFTLDTFKETDTLEIDMQQDTFSISYQRVVFETEKDFLRLMADSMQLVSHTFDSATLRCDFPNCANEDVNIRIFY